MIGFESEFNRFTEPTFETETLIFLAKENNVSSEQTFIISFQQTDLVPQGSGFVIAQEGEDYRGILPRPFLPSDQRLSLTFTLLADRVPERTEAFQISLSPLGSPAFNNANVLFTRTFVVIDDNDRKSKLNFFKS